MAILGTFGMSVWFIALPGGAAAFSPVGADQVGWLEAVMRAVPNGKLLALLTLLFGIGMELQYRAAVRRGLRWPGRYLRRAGILMVEGFLHYLLVFEWDVLMSYAVTSVLVAYLIGRSERVIRGWIIGVGAVYVTLIALTTAVMVAFAEPAAGVARSTEPLPSTEHWPDQVWGRLVGFADYRFETLVIVPSGIVLFLGAALLLRHGIFGDDGNGRRLRARSMGIGFGLGVPLHVWTTWTGALGFLAERYIAGPLIAVGLLALITETVLRIRRPGMVQGWLAAVGRTALTCYVLQNVVATTLAYDWGLGLTSRLGEPLGPFYPVLLWCVIAVVDVVFALLWLRRFDRGPLEMVAHRLAGAR